MTDPVTPATPQPPPAAQPVGYSPSNSTTASCIGAGIAALLFIVLKQFKVEVDPVSAATIGGAISAALGYFFEGGRK